MIRQSNELKFKNERRIVLKIIVSLIIGLIGYKAFADGQKEDSKKSDSSKKSKEQTKSSTDKQSSSSDQESSTTSDNDKTSQEKKK